MIGDARGAVETGSPAREPAWKRWPSALGSAVRAVLASPKYSLPALVSILLGIGATTTVFAIFSSVVLRPLPFRDEASLVEIFDDLNAPGLDRSPLSATEVEEYSRLDHSLASVAAYEQAEGTVTGLGEAKHVTLAHVTLNFFETLGVFPRPGRGFVSSGAGQDSANVAVVSHRFWLSELGGGEAIGRTLVVDGAPCAIVGVLPDDMVLPAGAEIWTPIHFTAEQSTSRGYRFLAAIARVNEGVTVESARREMGVVSSNIQATLGSEERPVKGVIVPLRQQLLGSTSVTAEIMLSSVCLFLLLACANVASLLLTRASVRYREFAIRAAIGARPHHLLAEAVLEATIIALAGSLLGFALAYIAMGAVANAYADLLAYARPTVDARVMAFFFLVCTVTVLLVSAAPALRAARVRPMDALRDGSRGSVGKAGRRFREALVAVQVAAAVALLVGATVLTRSMVDLTRVNPGFDPAGVLTARVSLPADKYGDDERLRQFHRELTEAVASLPGVTCVGTTSVLPLGDSYQSYVAIDMHGADPVMVPAEERHVAPDYFKAMGIELLRGRALAAEDGAATEKVAVVNRSFAASFFGKSDAIGQRFASGPPAADGGPAWIRIVGVVEDTHDFGLDTDPKATFYLPFAQAPVIEFSVVVRRTGAPEQLVPELVRQLRSIDPGVPLYAVTTMRQTLESSYANRTVLKWLLLAFAGAALVLAAVGLFGVTSYSVSLRFREIGIRRAIGAAPKTIFAMILVETGAVVGAGAAAGLVAAWYGTSFLSSMTFGISASGPSTYAIVALVVLGISLFAAFSPARTAASVNPAIALRAD